MMHAKLERRDLEDLIESIKDEACTWSDFVSVAWPVDHLGQRVPRQLPIRPRPDRHSTAACSFHIAYPEGTDRA